MKPRSAAGVHNFQRPKLGDEDESGCCIPVSRMDALVELLNQEQPWVRGEEDAWLFDPPQLWVTPLAGRIN